MGSYGPIMVYDSNHRQIRFVDEGQARAALAKLLILLKSYGLDHADELLRQWLSIPRHLSCIIPKFHIENFGPLHMLGGGGFGTVFRAEHKLDGKQYAIKVVSGIRSTRDLELVRSEVCLMAQLNHKNIVQYVTSWIEYGFAILKLPNEDDDNDDTSTASASSSYPVIHPKQLCFSPDRSKRSDAGSFISGQISDSFDAVESSNSGCSGHQLAIRCPRETARQSDRITSPKPVMFIQMELCQYNLASWLEHRNQQLTKSTGRPESELLDSLVPHSPARWISDQLASGVGYLHAQHMLHRDLKPENVLLCGPDLTATSHSLCVCESTSRSWTNSQPTNHSPPVCYHAITVKICDFGLAKFLRQSNSPLSESSTFPSYGFACLSSGSDESAERLEQPRSAYSSLDRQTVHARKSTLSHLPSSDNSISKREIHSCPARLTDRSTEQLSLPDRTFPHSTRTNQANFLLTANLGSAMYAAPEVYSSSNRPSSRVHYNYKADIFSMGVIFLQLFHPFRTLHELLNCLQPLSGTKSDVADKSISLPLSMLVSWPMESELVSRMLQKEAVSRPSAGDVLHSLGPTSEVADLAGPRKSLVVLPSACPSDSSDPCATVNSSSMHQLLDFLIWKNKELERELMATRRRLSAYERPA